MVGGVDGVEAQPAYLQTTQSRRPALGILHWSWLHAGTWAGYMGLPTCGLCVGRPIQDDRMGLDPLMLPRAPRLPLPRV